MIPTSQAHICFWRIISTKDFREINSLKSDFSILFGFVLLNFIIHIIQFFRFLDYLTIKLGEYYHQRNCGGVIHWSCTTKISYLFLSLYWRTQALQVGWGEYCPLVYSTYERMVSYLGKEQMSTYQIACNWFSNLFAADFFSMKSQTTSISSFAPDSKPCESWKIKLLPSYVISCSISCMPLWWYAIREYTHSKPLTHLNWWYQMGFRRFQFFA